MSKSNETTPNVPTLRFDKLKDFHRQKLGTLCTIVGGYAFDSKKMIPKGNYQIVKMGNFYAGKLDLSRTPTFLDNPTQSELSALLKKHDIVITLTGTVNKKDYGYTVQINNENNLLLNQRCALIRAKNNIDSNYLLYLLKANEFLSQFYASSVGGTGNQTNVSIKAIEQFIVSIPHLDEQKRIGKFLSDIDKRILVQNKIISKYETLIKGIRHRIFGSICGEKQSSLGGFLEEYSEKNVANNLQSVAVGKYGIRKREEIYSKELSADYSKNKVIRKNTLIIGMGSTQIDIGILTTDDCYCVSPAYTTYRIKGINSFYLQEYLIELNPLLSVRYMITSARQGKAVNKEDLMKHLMTIHSESEQKEICKCFENLYSRLQIEKEMLSALQKQKAFLLQSMFI